MGRYDGSLSGPETLVPHLMRICLIIVSPSKLQSTCLERARMTEEEYRAAQIQVERDRIEVERARMESESRITSRHFAAILGAAISVAGLAISGSQIWVAKVQKEKELELQERKFSQEQRAAAEEASRKANLEAVRLVIEQREAIFSNDPSRRDVVVEQLEVVLPANIAQRLFARLAKQGSTFYEAEQRVRARFVPVRIEAANFSRARNVEVGGGLAQQYGADLLHNGPPYNDQENLVEYDIQIDAAGNYELLVQYASYQQRPVQISVNGSTVSNAGLGRSTGGWTIANLVWEQQGIVSLIEGRNVLRFYRNGVFPHLRMIELKPVLSPAKAGG